MNFARLEEFCDRIAEEMEVVENHFRENPMQAHMFRVANVLHSAISFDSCGLQREHPACFLELERMAQHIYSLAIIRPLALEEIYFEFKNDIDFPENFIRVNWAGIETHEYPIPEELLPA